MIPHYQWLGALHDGSVDGVERPGPGTVTLLIGIEYLSELLIGEAGALRVELRGVRRAFFQPIPLPPVQEGSARGAHEIEPGDFDFTILSVEADGDGVCVHGEEGQLLLSYDSAEVFLPSGESLTGEQIERAAAVYWHRWEARSAVERLGLRLRLAGQDDRPVLEELFRHQLEVIGTYNPNVDQSLGLQSDWIEKPGVLFAWLLERPAASGEPEVLGLALVGNHRLSAAMDSRADHYMWEYHVGAKYRRMGVGAAGLELLHREHPGTWTVEVLPNNGRAMAFWGASLRPFLTGTKERVDEDGVTFVRHAYSTRPWVS